MVEEWQTHMTHGCSDHCPRRGSCPRCRKLADGDVALVAHGHFTRILTAVYLRMAPRFASQITLDAGSVLVLVSESVSVLSFYREQPAIMS